MSKETDPQTQLARRLRKNMTKEEGILWNTYLRRYPLRIMRQRPIDRYIVDFYCAKAKLAIELDGSGHYEFGEEYDRERDRVLGTYGIKVLRIPNNEVNRNLRGVCETIDAEIKKRSGFADIELDPSVSRLP